MDNRHTKNCPQCESDFKTTDPSQAFCSDWCKEAALADLDKDSDECLSCQ